AYQDFEAKYIKVKAKLALFGSNASAPNSSSGKKKGLITETYDWDEEEVSSNDNEVTEVKALMALVDEERVSVGKESARNGIDQLTKDTSSSGPKVPVFVKSSVDNSEVSITSSNKPKLFEAEDSTLSNHDIGKHPLHPPEKLTGVEPDSGPKTIKSILKSKSTFKAETLKGFIMNEPPSAPARGNKSSSAFKTNSALAGESSSRSRPSMPAIPFSSCIHYGYNNHRSDDCVYYPICEIYGSYDHDTHGHNKFISLRRGIKSRNSQHVTKNCETCGSNVHTTSDHNDIEWFRKKKALQAKKVKSFKTSKTESSSALRSKTPTKSLGLQYPKRPGFDLKGYLDSDCVEATWTGKALQLLLDVVPTYYGSRVNSLTMISYMKRSRILLSKRDIECHFIPTQYQLADVFIKLLDKSSFKRLIDELGMMNIDSKPEASRLTEENSSERKEVPHHLIDILHPAEDYSAGNFYDDGRQAAKDILNRGRVPIVTGGTGLYLRWFIYGKPDVPKATAEISLEVQSELATFERRYDWDAAVELVMKAGDSSAQSLPANDWYRLRRKLEIIKESLRI
nr:tRNA dimethylallyltransferase 9 [Tanacetum cinerariifolium]